MQKIRVPIQILPHGDGLSLPDFATLGSAGMDLRAAIESTLEILPHRRVRVPCGFSMELPQGLEGQIRSRSGLAFKQGLLVLNAPGTVDSDYRGEVCVLLANMSEKAATIQRGERIAQMVIAPYIRVEWEVVEKVGDSDRGEKGFGSTGVI